MKLRLLIPTLVAALFLSDGAAASGTEEQEPLFEVRFTKDGVTFTGKMDSEENALTLAEAVKEVRPDLKILNRGLRIDETAQLPSTGDLKSLLAELGISTHEGRFSLYRDSLILGGLTDSRITLTALRIRLAPMLKDREFVNRLCIVNKDDMPNLSIRLSSGEVSGPLLDFDVAPTAAEAYEPPGLSLANLFPMMLTLSDLSRLTGTPSMTQSDHATTAPKPVPLLQVRNIGGRKTTPAPGVLRAVPAEPQPTYVPLPSIYYTHSSFLLQADQESTLESILEQLSTPPLAGHQILVRPVAVASQSGAFGDYLVEKRGTAAKELLTGRGIPAGLITVESVAGEVGGDNGEVRLIVRIPPPLPEAEPESEAAAEAPPESNALAPAPAPAPGEPSSASE